MVRTKDCGSFNRGSTPRNLPNLALVAELVDALDSSPGVLRGVRVRVSPRAFSYRGCGESGKRTRLRALRGIFLLLVQVQSTANNSTNNRVGGRRRWAATDCKSVSLIGRCRFESCPAHNSIMRVWRNWKTLRI